MRATFHSSYQVKTVQRWVKRYHDKNNIHRLPQPGQKRKLDEDQRNAVVEKIQKNPFLNAAVVGRETRLERFGMMPA